MTFIFFTMRSAIISSCKMPSCLGLFSISCVLRYCGSILRSACGLFLLFLNLLRVLTSFEGLARQKVTAARRGCFACAFEFINVYQFYFINSSVQMRLLYKSSLRYGHRFEQTRAKLSVEEIVRGAKREEFYVRKHAEEIGDAIVKDVRERKWMEMKYMLRQIQINELDSWRVFRNISKAMNESCNGVDMRSMSESQVEDMLDCTQLLKFEPASSMQNESMRQMEYDDSTEFIQKMKQYISLVERQKRNNFMIDLARKVLHTMPTIFLPHRTVIQNYILQNFEKLLLKRLLLNEVFTKGCISNFWTKQFIKSIQSIKLKEKPIDPQLLKSFRFQDLTYPTLIQKSQKPASLRTEGQIENILTGYGYSLNMNPLINGYQVDFLIANKIIVQYNGHHHYIINSNKSISNSKDRWKNRILIDRGFFVCSVNYDEWKWLKTFEQRRSFLLQKVEKSWLEHYASGRKAK